MWCCTLPKKIQIKLLVLSNFVFLAIFLGPEFIMEIKQIRYPIVMFYKGGHLPSFPCYGLVLFYVA